MRTWISFRTPIRGNRVGAGVSLPAARLYHVSATGQKVALFTYTGPIVSFWVCH
jgi:hypothetical protein